MPIGLLGMISRVSTTPRIGELVKMICMYGVMAVAIASGCSGDTMVSSEEARLEHDTNMPIGNPGACYREEGQCVCPTSPIVIDTAGDGISLGGPSDPVVFALGPRPGLWSWTRPGDDAWLAIDANRNDRIDSGRELFGDTTLQETAASPNGYTALAFYDAPERGGNGDGRISATDAIWEHLRLWFDRDHDGAGTGELAALGSVGITSLSTAATPSALVDAYGNEFRLESTLTKEPWATVGTTTYDVWLQPGTLGNTGAVAVDTDSSVEWLCRAWIYTTDRSTDDCEFCSEIICHSAYVDQASVYPFVVVVGQEDGSEGEETYYADVARGLGLSADKATAISQAASQATQAARECNQANFLALEPDPIAPPPYDRDPAQQLGPRVKCVQVVVPTPTGGGGGGGTC